MDAVAKSKLLIDSIRNELKSGTEHYNKEGVKLITIKDILECLLKEGSVTIKRPE